PRHTRPGSGFGFTFLLTEEVAHSTLIPRPSSHPIRTVHLTRVGMSPRRAVFDWRAAERMVVLLASALVVRAPAGPAAVQAQQYFPERSYHLVGVSGGLQDGFAARHCLDYHAGLDDESKALLVGNALVKGYKAFLDVKQKGWREYVEEPGNPLVNPVVVPSGCAEHANIYAIYAVDSRQVLKALLMEPRFLSMTPDTGLVDLTAEETSQSVRTLARYQARLEGKTDLDSAAFLIVTGVWAPGSLVDSPVLYTKENGTQVTDYPRSMAIWAGTTDDARLSDDETERAGYWTSLRQATRRVETETQQQQELDTCPAAETGVAEAASAADFV
ncbi:unnamed protein product, partial [Pylaiella littoralis]